MTDNEVSAAVIGYIVGLIVAGGAAVIAVTATQEYHPDCHADEARIEFNDREICYGIDDFPQNIRLALGDSP